MGPRLESRGKLRTARLEILGDLRLQWGRGSKAAERGSPGSLPPARRCFNGAAARKPRKAPGHGLVPTRGGSLQWGRGSKAAERNPTRTFAPIPQCFNGAAARKPRKGPAG